MLLLAWMGGLLCNARLGKAVCRVVFEFGGVVLVGVGVGCLKRETLELGSRQI